MTNVNEDPSLTLDQLARRIEAGWKNVSPYARPYLDAMHSLRRMSDRYYMDPADEIVARFLSNARGWRGEEARAVKATLKMLLDEHRKGRHVRNR